MDRASDEDTRPRRALALVVFAAVSCACGPAYSGTVEEIRLHSEHVGEDFDVQVYLPAGGVQSGERVPVVFQLDGSWQGASVAAIAHDHGHRVIVVAITAAEDASSSRLRDFTPTVDPADPRATGGADAFFRFLDEELVPYIDARYPTDTTQRALMGHSLAGLYAVYHFFRQRGDTPVFAHIAAASPSLWWDSGSIFELEAQNTDAEDWASSTLFVSSATLEPPDIVLYTTALETRLESGPSYESVRWTVRSYSETGHSWSWENAYPDALSFFYQ
jgi:predicted alpha/beta superfamily hydrolase